MHVSNIMTDDLATLGAREWSTGMILIGFSQNIPDKRIMDNHCLSPYGIIDLDQYWFGWWFVAYTYQVITRGIAELLSIESLGTKLGDM